MHLKTGLLPLRNKLDSSISPSTIEIMEMKMDEGSLHRCCDLLGDRDTDLKNIITQFGYPPFWNRKPGFETLIHIILEQQVSLACARAALVKLQIRIKKITPESFLTLSDEELKACYFSRQKMRYSRELADAIRSNKLDLKKLGTKSDEEIKNDFKKIAWHWQLDGRRLPDDGPTPPEPFSPGRYRTGK